jgi:hypothetical protein
MHANLWASTVECRAVASDTGSCNAIAGPRIRDGVHEFVLTWVREGKKLTRARAARAQTAIDCEVRLAALLEEKKDMRTEAREQAARAAAAEAARSARHSARHSRHRSGGRSHRRSRRCSGNQWDCGCGVVR